jgi:hypothetical protein
LAVGLVLAAPMLAQDPTKSTPTPDEMKQALTKASALGPQHAQLKPLAGKWNIVGKCRMGPDAAWQEHKDTCTADLILGGRFLQQQYKGDAMFGMPTPFEGTGFIGYDNQKQKFVSVWMDNMGTMVLTSEGTSDDSGKTITFRSADYTCPITGQKTYTKTVYQIEGNDKFVMKMYGPGPDGKEFQTMELVHTRSTT